MASTDDGFAVYLAQYRSKHQKKYLPPFLKDRLKREYEESIRGQQRLSINQNEEDTKEEVSSADDASILQLYSKHSSYFTEWLNLSRSAYDNQYVAAFYNGSCLSLCHRSTVLILGNTK